jgi:predicted Rossmann fold flavoprotein
VALKVGDKTFKDSLLFAHKGISGPSVLNASLYWQKGKVSIDFLPSHNLKTILNQDTKKQLSSVLPLPKRFTKAFLKTIKLKDNAISKLTNIEQQKLYMLNNYDFAPAGNFGFSKAEVSLGGILTDELKESFEVKKVKNLYFIGEALDITGELGGYNFQWAFSSGYVCAKKCY